MTDERLEEIRDQHSGGFVDEWRNETVGELLAEVDQLRSKLSAERGRLL